MVFMRYKRWIERGVLWKVLMCLQKANVLEVQVAFMDSTVQACGRSPQKRGCQVLGRSKDGFDTKLPLLVDGAGRLLSVLLSPG